MRLRFMPDCPMHSSSFADFPRTLQHFCVHQARLLDYFSPLITVQDGQLLKLSDQNFEVSQRAGGAGEYPDKHRWAKARSYSCIGIQP
jgi:hypothetical protein